MILSGSPCVLAIFFFPPLVSYGVMALLFPLVHPHDLYILVSRRFVFHMPILHAHMFHIFYFLINLFLSCCATMEESNPFHLGLTIKL